MTPISDKALSKNVMSISHTFLPSSSFSPVSQCTKEQDRYYKNYEHCSDLPFSFIPCVYSVDRYSYLEVKISSS